MNSVRNWACIPFPIAGAEEISILPSSGIIPSAIFGHRWKNVYFKGCNIKEELDLFAFGYDAEKRQYTKVLKVMTRYNIQAKVVDLRYKLQTGSYSKQITKIEADSLISTLTLNDSK